MIGNVIEGALGHRAHARRVGMPLVATLALLALGGCALSGRARSVPEDRPTSSPTATSAAARAQGDSALRLVQAVPGPAWQRVAEPQSSPCTIGSDDGSLVLQWHVEGPRLPHGEEYVARVRSTLRDDGWKVTTRSTTLEDYGTSYQVVGSKGLVSAVVVAVNDNHTSIDMESVCTAATQHGPTDDPD